MIVTDTLKTRGGLDFLWADETGAEEALRYELSKIIVHEGENIGAFIRPESVYYSKREDKTRFEFVVTAYWCPDPRKGCEFRGGPNDGKILPIGTEHTRPPDYYRLPPEYAPPSIDLGPDFLPSPAFESGMYRLWGIDSALDRWVYKFDR